MASSSHQPFSNRPYAGGLARPGPSSAAAAAAPQSFAGTGFGAAAGQTQQAREAQRLERERAERAEKERQQNQFNELSDEHREEINEAFALFDLDKDNYIDYHELKVALKALGFDLPKPDLLDILTLSGVPASSVHPPAGSAKAAASSSTGPPAFTGPNRRLLSLQAFQMHTAALIVARDPRTEIERAFDLFDVEGKGMISLTDLRRVARELGEGLQEEELAAMIEEFDMDGDGMISKEEFIGICLG